MRLNESGCKACTWVMAAPCFQYKLGDVRMEHSPAKKDLGVLVDGKLDMSQQRALAAQNPGLHQKKCGQQVREVILPQCSALVRPHLEYCVQMWSYRIIES